MQLKYGLPRRIVRMAWMACEIHPDSSFSLSGPGGMCVAGYAVGYSYRFHGGIGGGIKKNGRFILEPIAPSNSAHFCTRWTGMVFCMSASLMPLALQFISDASFASLAAI